MIISLMGKGGKLIRIDHSTKDSLRMAKSMERELLLGPITAMIAMKTIKTIRKMMIAMIRSM